MPIGVPLIICGSIALVGSGYAFKKLVYDQHLAHYIEAFIANHLPSKPDPALAAPVPAHSNVVVEGRSSAWFNGVDRLRRRGKGKQEEEDGEPLIRLDERLDHYQREELSRPIRPRADSPTPHNERISRPQGIAHESDQRIHTLNDQSIQSPNHNQSHDDEIKSAIFKLPSIPKSIDQASRTTPLDYELSDSSQLLPPGHEAGPSGTFSFLSLSQVSSPEAPAAMLDSMTFSQFGSMGGTIDSVYAEGEREGERLGRDEVMIMPDTGYTSEAFSNISSPRSGISRLEGDNRERTQVVSGAGTGGLGLAVEDLGMSFIPLRRQESVMSLSDSEGGSGSDWERISVARST